jgi:hypothetical protein
MSLYIPPVGLREDEPVLVLVDHRDSVFREQPFTVKCVAMLQIASGSWRAVSVITDMGGWWRLDKDNEGVNWARGWETSAANALRVVAGLL